MKTNSKVALIYPYFRTHSQNELLFPPLGAAALQSQLRLQGIESQIFDCTFSSMKELQKALLSYGPAIAGIYSMITMSRNSFSIAAMVKSLLPACLLVAGGPLPTLYPDQYGREFDLVFRGEADVSFPCFCQDYFDAGSSRAQLKRGALKNYAGLYRSNDPQRVSNPVGHHSEEEIKLFPAPDRSSFAHALYQKFWLKRTGTKTTSIITTLGCPQTCDFCSRPIFGNLFRRKNLDSVFEEIHQIGLLGYDNLWIADDNFTLDAAFLAEFCRRMQGTGMSWSCLSRVTGLNREIVDMMRAAGCQKVYLGLESGSRETLALMKKKATLEQGVEAVNLFHEAGIASAAFFIVGYPGETAASIEKTFAFALDLPLDEISFNVPFPLPGSPLFDRITTVDQSKDWNRENEVCFVYKSEFDPIYLQHRIDQTMMEFREKKKNVAAFV
ncbi:MAG: radical SAM protein [Chitinivibrionales bacterium]|nr:radical SAM protein [Chitinivibrionales bacterium]